MQANCLRDDDYILVHGVKLRGIDKCKELNYFLVNVGAGQYYKDVSNFLGFRNPRSMYLDPADKNKVFSTIMNLRNTKSKYACKMKIEPIKHVLRERLEVVQCIHNLVLSSRIFPDSMQIDGVVVTYKGGKTYISNYRSIPILPILLKGVQNIMLFSLSCSLKPRIF